MRRFWVAIVLVLLAVPLYAQDETRSPVHTLTIRGGDEFTGINGASWSPDGAYILAWGGNDQIVVWNADNGRRRFAADVTGRGWWNADGDRVFTYDYVNDEVIAWEVPRGRAAYRVPNISPLDVLSPDGAALITVEPGTAYVRNATDGEQLHTLESLPFTWFWLDNTRIGATEAQQFHVWDVAAGERISRFDYEGFVADYTSERLLTTQAQEFVRVRLYDIERGLGARVYRINGNVTQAKIAPSGEYLYIAAREDENSTQRLLVWDVFEGEVVTLDPATEDETRVILEFSVSPDETQVLTISFALDDDDAQIIPETERATVWDATTGEALLELPQEGLTQGLWSPDGSMIAVWGNMGGALWDVEQEAVLFRFSGEGFVGGVTFSPDGAQMGAWQGKDLFVWDLQSE